MSVQRASPKVVKRPDWKSVAIVGAHIGFVLAPVYLAVAMGPSVLWLGCWVWFGLSMQALLNLLHETAHLHVFRARQTNELLGRWLLGPLMFADFDRYREVHWAHHRRLGQDGDPKYSYKIAIRGRSFLYFTLRSLFLVEALRKLRYVHIDARPGVASRAERFWLVRVAVLQSVFIGSLYLVASGPPLRALLNVVLAYGFVYCYGILSLTVMAANLRAIAEHQLSDSQNEVVGVAALRNLASTPLTWMVFGAYGFADHATHHLNPAIPYYYLHDESRRLRGEHAASDAGYFEILIGIVGAREDSGSTHPSRGLGTDARHVS